MPKHEGENIKKGDVIAVIDNSTQKLDTASTTLSTAKSKLNNSNEKLKLLEEGSTFQSIDAAQAKCGMPAQIQLSLK